MITFFLATLVLAAPRTDGFYVDEAAFTLLSAPAVSEDELSFIEPARFTKDQVTVQYVLETQTHQWRSRDAGLEVLQGDAWAERVWRELPGDVVESDLLRAGTVERLHFVKGSLDERRQSVGRGFTSAQLKRLTGRYGEGKEALVVDAKSKLTATQCFASCAPFASVCLAAKNLLFIETDEGLVRLPGVEGLCGSARTGVEPKDGVALERMTTVAPVAVGKVDAKQLLAVLSARAARLAACNETKAPLHVKLKVTIGRAGLLVAVDAGEPQLSDCLGEALARLTFPTQNGSTTLTVEWDLPVRH